MGIIIPGIEYYAIEFSLIKYWKYATGFCNRGILSIMYALQYREKCKFNDEENVREPHLSNLRNSLNFGWVDFLQCHHRNFPDGKPSSFE